MTGAGSDNRAAAVTGLGAVTAIGNTLDAISSSLQAGRSGIVLDEERRRRGFRSALTGRIADFDPARWGLSRKMLRTMCEPAQYACAATRDALRDAGLAPEDLQNPRCGIVFGNDSTVKPVVESVDIVREQGETHFIGGGHIFRGMNSTVTMNLSPLLGTQGANWTVSAACASGAHAIGQALMLIRSGLQSIVLAGGAQETNWESMVSFDALGVFSLRQDDPERASRPFDADRDGLVPSGGAACLVLEELEHARKRGARIYGLVRGYGFASDGSHLTRPTGDGALRAMEAALADARVSPEDIDYVNAHATSTITGDRAEAGAIAALLGPDVPVSSTKSMTGHECWMGGASEALYACLMARDGFIAPNLNFGRLDGDCPPINVVAETLSHRVRCVLSNSFGFSGTNASLVLDFAGVGSWRGR
ncbi:MAG: beta-ketoacyl-[acyl-carrier-protein] synthase family protein [Candidatus Brocadiaceae bacterium]|nr:beta-ketoacyl-[acyl-carrier-protein] synthase family protein [Candidatus Brocadiaceae bacterium]